jgi:hypothetical protein
MALLDAGVGLDPVRISGEFQDGRAELGLRAGRWKVLAVPSDLRLAPSEWITVAEEDLAKPLAVVLRSRVLGTVRVCDGQGQPIAGAIVRVFDGVRGVAGPHASPHVTTPGALLCAKGRPANKDAVISEGVTGADGRVTLPGTLERAALTIDVRGPGIREASQQIEAWGTKEVVATIERGP